MNIAQPDGTSIETAERSWVGQLESWPRPEVFAFLFTVMVLILYRQLSQPEGGDSAIWDYVAQCILRGQVPYRDVVEIKGPGSAYISAIAMWIGKWFGVRDVLAVRLMQIVLVGLLSTITYLVARCYLHSRSAAMIAFMIPLMSGHFAGWMLEGTEPKLSMILFGMISMLLIAKDQPLWAGLFSMLSCLCWQPGLLFTGTAFLIFSRYLTTWRDLRALKVIIGAALPLLLVAIYFYSVNALADLWTWSVAYNYDVYGPEGTKKLSEQLVHIYNVIRRVMGAYVIFVVLGLAGAVAVMVQQVRSKLSGAGTGRSSDLFKDALLIAPMVYLIFCLVDFQAGPDLIPFFPFIGIFAAWFVVKIGRLVRDSRLVRTSALLDAVRPWLREGVIVIVLLITLICAGLHESAGPALAQQEREYDALSNMLGPQDRIYATGAVELLVLLNKPNLNPYVMWDRNKDTYVAAQRYGGSFKAIVDEMESQRPRLVAVSRLKPISARTEIELWLAAHYDKLPGYNDTVYLRKPE